MESKAVPSQLKMTHDKLGQLFNSSKDLKQSEADAQDVTRILGKMYGKFDREHIESTVDSMFRLARDKMESEKDKEVLAGLRQLVR